MWGNIFDSHAEETDEEDAVVESRCRDHRRAVSACDVHRGYEDEEKKVFAELSALIPKDRVATVDDL